MWNLCKRANTSSTLDDVINMLWLINFEIVIAKKIRKKNMAKIKMCERFTDHYKILQSLFDCWVFSGLQFIARILRVSLFLFFLFVSHCTSILQIIRVQLKYQHRCHLMER